MGFSVGRKWEMWREWRGNIVEGRELGVNCDLIGVLKSDATSLVCV